MSNACFGADRPVIARRLHTLARPNPIARRRFTSAALHLCGLLVALAWGAVAPQVASACPFCSSVSHTYSDDLKAATAGVLAEYQSVMPAKEPDGLPLHRLKIVDVVKGPASTLQGAVIETFSNAEIRRGQVCFLIACGDAPYQWSIPTVVSSDAIRYLKGIKSQAKDSRERLQYCLPFLASSDRLVADDAYNEFARASYAQVLELGDKLDRTWVLGRLKELPEAIHHRRLLWLLLGVCGKPEDAAVPYFAINRRRQDRKFDPGLDAAIACYVTLGGESALARIERELLGNSAADYNDTHAAIAALRAHGNDFKQLPRERLAKSLRIVLSRPPLADLVLPDLARWEDWSAIERVVELYEKADDKSQYVKIPAVNYLRACPKPEAKAAIERLRKLDPDGVARAETLFQAVPAPPVDAPAAKEERIKKAAEARGAGKKAEGKKEK